ncbi:MAG: hypothetical protein V1737_00650 [Chloroflexota bacterium]
MPAKAVIVTCKKCDCELRSDWNFCPRCGDKLACGGTYKAVCGRSGAPGSSGR